MAYGYVLLNPHLALRVRVAAGGSAGERYDTQALTPVNPGWTKWTPNRPTSAHWYTRDRLAGLITGYLSHDRDTGAPAPRLVRDFLTQFDGMSGTAKRKAVLDATGLHRATLRDLLGADGLDMVMVARLLDAMQIASRAVNPAALGAVGRVQMAGRFAGLAIHPDTFQYKQISGVTPDGKPWIVEAAFGWLVGGFQRHVFSGVNWSVALQSPFREMRWQGDSLDALLAGCRVAATDPVLVCVHLITPGAAFTDRGKSAVALSPDVALAITKAVRAVTKAWEAQKKREEGDAAALARREEELTAAARPKSMSIKDAAFLEMHRAYLKASAANTLPANARQIMYAARGAILKLTGRTRFSDAYFTQTLLPLFVQLNPELTADWDVIYDARGHLLEPHTGREIGLGTLEVRHYIGARPQAWLVSGGRERFRWHTVGPKHRFTAILFIEKEGFDQIILASGLLDRFDIALMSTKGMSVIAARQLVEHWAKNNPDVLVLVAHDFDVSGFTIFGTLAGDTWRHTYQTAPNVIDIGLRLEDVLAEALESESVAYQGKWEKTAATLARHGATEDEIEYLRGDEVVEPTVAHDVWEEQDEEEDEDQDEEEAKKPKKPRVNRRVELNAFTSDRFIAWLEGKLEEHGIEKVVPDEDTLDQAYRAAWQITERNRVLALNEARITRAAEHLSPPDDLRERVAARLALKPEMPWDEALVEVVADLGEPEPPPPMSDLDERLEHMERLMAENPDMSQAEAIGAAFTRSCPTCRRSR